MKVKITTRQNHHQNNKILSFLFLSPLFKLSSLFKATFSSLLVLFLAFIVPVFVSLGCGRASKLDNNPINDHLRDDKLFSECPLKFTKQHLCANYVWQVRPVPGKMASFTLVFWSDQDTSLTPTLVDPPGFPSVRLLMSMNGHSHDYVNVSIRSPQTGKFIVSNVFFSMHGDWKMIISLIHNSAGTVIEEASTDLTL